VVGFTIGSRVLPGQDKTCDKEVIIVKIEWLLNKLSGYGNEGGEHVRDATCLTF
jgi:hypothetical protein